MGLCMKKAKQTSLSSRQTLGLNRFFTALDPAGPYFSVDEDGNSIHKSDGDFVDVIHTNSGPLWQVRN